MAALRQAATRGDQTRRRSEEFRARGSSSRSEALLKDTEADRGDSHGGIPAAYAALGGNYNMFALLFDQIGRGDLSRNLLPSIRPCDSLHRDPRWNELVRRVNGPRGTVHAFP